MIERFGPRAGQPSVLDLLPGWMLRGVAGQLFGQRWFARRVVLDDWFFHVAQPPLAAAKAGEPRTRRSLDNNERGRESAAQS